MKQFNARVGSGTIAIIETLQEAMAKNRGLSRKLSQGEVIEVAIQDLATKELPADKKNSKKSAKST